MRTALAVAGAAALALGLAIVRSGAPDGDEHREFTAVLAARHALDQEVSQHALEARFQFAANYDQLAQDDAEARRLDARSTAAIPRFLRKDERQRLERALSQYAALEDRREVLLERFKSKNALLKNSVNYFPTLALDVIRHTADPALHAQVDDLRLETLSLALRTDRGASEAQALRISSLGAAAAVAGAAERHQMQLMLAHAGVIAAAKADADALLRDLLEMPIEEARDDVGAQYQEGYRRAARLSSIVFVFVSGLALTLLLLVAYAWVRLQRAAAELNRANERLEGAVVERTSELATANRDLKEAMARRARMEIDLRHAQKLESVGQLASGIAHEINTPIQYIGDSVHFLRDAFADLLKVIAAYRGVGHAAGAEGDARVALAHAHDAEEEADLDYLEKEVPSAIVRTLEGTRHVARIVSAMKHFAHTSVDKALADVNAAIENTLTVAHNEYKYVADVTTELGEVPAVTCNVGGVCQLVLNLVVNAAHAIGDRVGASGERGTIRIRTERRGGDVVLSVADTGAGIPAEIRSRIFDPFFTTKPVGKGSGQGLAIVQSIVDQHGGKLWFETEVGEGTTFFVALPIDASDRRSMTAAAA